MTVAFFILIKRKEKVTYEEILTLVYRKVTFNGKYIIYNPKNLFPLLRCS